MLPTPPILFITDSKQTPRPLVDVVAAALRGGCRWVLLREHALNRTDPDAFFDLATDLAGLCREAQAALFISRNTLVATAARAQGVHLRAKADPWLVRRFLGEGSIIGQSCHSKGEAVRAEQNGVDYLTLSPIFMTQSKPDTRKPLGLATLQEIAALLPLPVIALGGMTPERAKACLDSGAAGIAVMGDLMRATDVAARMAEYVALFKKP